MNITELKNGESARVKELGGAGSLKQRLEELGIVPGTELLKKSASVFRGPLVLQKGSTQLAIGYALAKNIIVDRIA